jgi:hypothetical protein
LASVSSPRSLAITVVLAVGLALALPAVSPSAAAASSRADLADRSAPPAARAAASSARQVAVGREVIRIGRWRIPTDFRLAEASMASAERALGQGRERFAYRSADGGRLVDDPFSCMLMYSSSGLTIGFSTLGFQDEARAGCDNASEIYVGSAHIYGNQWETSRGLGVGDSVRTLRRLYPAARSHRLGADTPGKGRSWWLKRKRTACCGGILVPTLEAVVADGRVKRLIVNVGAQGE